MSLEDLPSLRDTLIEQGLMAKKSFGQHFLLDLNVTRKIVRQAEPLDGHVVIEVGPGPGGLTRALLESGAHHVIAVEKDPRFLPLLGELSEAAPGRLTVIEADALEVDEAALSAAHGGTPRTTRIISNLPYNVGTPLLLKWLTGPFTPFALTLMFQKEVAQRVAAKPGSNAYGRLSVISQALAECRVVMTLPARAFTPPPKVDSAVAHLVLKTDRPSDAVIRALESVTHHAFGQRRKMLRSSLKALGGEALCARAGVDANQRAETIDIAGFIRLAEESLKGP
jgi:16S rRNA (adenine1518-N6/adenine1519-N6)-dimethyltransferase